MRFRSAASSHPGLVRENNEDRVYADDHRGLFIVIDGMGGHAAGEVAADMALKSIKTRLERRTDSVERRIREAIALANNAIYKSAQDNPDWNGMACVLTIAVIADGQATIGQVGDSRLYKIRQGRMEKLTHDHSPIGEREDRGELTEEQAMQHPRRNEVYRDVGSREHTPDDPDFIEISTVPFDPDSALLLCSDGLSDVVPSAEILRIVQEHAGHPRAAVRELIESANRSSKDNVSAVLVEGESFAKSKRKLNQRFWPYLAAGIVLGGLLMYAALKFLYTPVAQPRILAVASQASIAAVLERAVPGDTVEIAPGEYTEELRLKDGVDLVAQKDHEATITGSITAEGISRSRITGLHLRGGDIGIRIKDANVTIERVEITGTRLAAIEFSGSSSGVVEASFLHDNAGAGIVVKEPARPILIGNNIVENGAKAKR